MGPGQPVGSGEETPCALAEGWVPRAPGPGRVSLWHQADPCGREQLLASFPLGNPLFLEKESQGMAGPSVERLWINNRILEGEDPAARGRAVNGEETGSSRQAKPGQDERAWLFHLFFLPLISSLSALVECLLCSQ